MFHSHFPIPASHYNAGELSSEDVELSIRQHPKEALLAVTGKEKFRKPVDPPPILQLKVKPGVDPSQHFLQSPYLFMCCTLWHPEKDEPYKASGSSRSQSLSGGLTSSLHRLKDVNNTDGGFFVFGDVSCKVVGTHRLHFSLYDLRKPRTPSRENYATCLGTITSDKFVVQPAKDFKGLEESTYLSRAFSDQGVRLRLRKEPRAMMGRGRKRAFAAMQQQTATQSIPDSMPPPISLPGSQMSGSHGHRSPRAFTAMQQSIQQQSMQQQPMQQQPMSASMPPPMSLSSSHMADASPQSVRVSLSPSMSLPGAQITDAYVPRSPSVGTQMPAMYLGNYTGTSQLSSVYTPQSTPFNLYNMPSYDSRLYTTPTSGAPQPYDESWQ